MTLSIYIVLGLIAATYTWGTTVAYFSRKYPTLDYTHDDYAGAAWFAAASAVLPFMAIVIFCISDFNKYGWCLVADNNKE